MVTSLLSRQEEVIAELDLLEAQILEVIEDLSAQRKTEIADEETEIVQMDSLPIDPVPNDSVPDDLPIDSAKKKPLSKAA